MLRHSEIVCVGLDLGLIQKKVVEFETEGFELVGWLPVFGGYCFLHFRQV